MNLPSSLPCERWTVTALTQLVQLLSVMDLVTALLEMITSFVTALAQWIVSVLTGGSPFSLFVVMILIVLILGKLRGDNRY